MAIKRATIDRIIFYTLLLAILIPAVGAYLKHKPCTSWNEGKCLDYNNKRGY